MTRIASIVGLMFGFVLFASTVATATPTVRFKAAFVPIRGFPHTGNILGAGAAVDAEYQIEGTEYGGFPPPIVGVDFYLPSGTKLHMSGFATCAKSVLEQTGPSGCRNSSEAGPIGNVLAIVSFGNERVEESATLQSFYAPEGGLEFFTNGHSPVSLEILSAGHYVNLGGAGGFGPELITQVPLVATVPSAPYASVKSINVKTGSAYKSGGGTVYYGRVPKKCPKGGFPFETEVIFDRGGANPPVPEPVTATYTAPCPKRSVEEGPPETEPNIAPPQTTVPQTTLPGTGGAITAPSNAKCVSRRDFVIHVQKIKGLRYRRVEVAVNGRTATVVTGRRLQTPVDLMGLPKGSYTVLITVQTTSGQTLHGTRTYHTCEPKPLPPRRHPL